MPRVRFIRQDAMGVLFGACFPASDLSHLTRRFSQGRKVLVPEPEDAAPELASGVAPLGSVSCRY